ncbi:hypothetical protein BC941DRAFT_517551 [Chlamydoabsidia padenii]|nr:hypothetical protein BC941DRAFT_517551 [Chlamydoabsidia padenii]
MTLPNFLKRPSVDKETTTHPPPIEANAESHLIFRLPEIVEQIIQHLIPAPMIGSSCVSHKSGKNAHSRSSSKMVQDVLPLLYVNWLWHDCVSRYTWRHVAFEDNETDYGQLLKFASAISGGVSMSALSPSHSTPALVVSTPSDASTTPTRCEQKSSSKRIDSFKPLFPSLMYMLYQQKQETPNPETPIKAELDLHDPLFASTYQNRVRSLTLRKIKKRNINYPLQHIGYHVPYLTTLDIYICDHVTNTALYPFLEHGQLTYLSLAGCQRINDEAILQVAATCPLLEHLDLRACGLVSDTSIASIALSCPRLRHLNVGRVKDREHITDGSIELIARHTQVSVLGLAGCDITDVSLILLARLREIERVSINNCHKVSDHAVRAFAQHCPRLSVFEMKECHRIHDWETVASMVKRKVLLTLCNRQSRACEEWAKRHGLTLNVQAPIK